jgi:CheY-like chemotaxis protein
MPKPDLVHSELQHGGIACEVRRVRNESELIHELARRPVDVILADRYCPENDGLRASRDRASADSGGPGYFSYKCK